MFDYDLELKKFKPAVGVEIGEVSSKESFNLLVANIPYAITS